MLIIRLLICLFVYAPITDTWKRTETDQHISFLMPYTPEKFSRTIGGMESFVYQTKDETCVFGIVCTDFSKGKVPLTNESVLQLYEQLRIGSLSVETAILKGEKTVEYAKMLIKEIEYSVIKDNNEMTYFKRFIFRDNMVYQISIGGRTRHWDIILEEKEIFFNSIYFKEEVNSSFAD
ncbi:hypothetical protein LJB85_00555 [Porphyromonadaceae bacterium OttesenSCG-928-L07]|nr:hypothetical protein [Porphyromonadaceae bacterium OttesenSCG-928-L07]MDL2252276.1 hypothetical protein [Odoribacter sp. OttesenSCG-928-J03]MDL2330770.1 hypothetical protein [Odoribacter sp. OttesenSCG-928-A06]